MSNTQPEVDRRGHIKKLVEMFELECIDSLSKQMAKLHNDINFSLLSDEDKLMFYKHIHNEYKQCQKQKKELNLFVNTKLKIIDNILEQSQNFDNLRIQLQNAQETEERQIQLYENVLFELNKSSNETNYDKLIEQTEQLIQLKNKTLKYSKENVDSFKTLL
ncbi:unnamed protein product [Didymodactylos carnosus]|uniref:Uncharacterized protein n=1 Tax=Didymodactylos carnosus TaxID=1234261 RepID=A0A813NN60_9BILA|nr:unnamed protein product [Didymodactylos carnosus]CAF0832675.1 unnamed protein product [Didymodactylos carnosus]CAF3516203.1 unnamed protein product [Didymodactylos carnosus]CAF3617296.1 unnamed protein product [Didymodactylos carnosus]